MKNVLLAALAAPAIIISAGCEQFTTSYQRIDDSEFRMLDFIYEPADASPGDTVTLTAVFAGKKADLDDIDWWISFNIRKEIIFGSMTVVDSMPFGKVEGLRRIDTVFSPNTQAVAFRIPIPIDIMKTSPQIPHQWTDMLPDEVFDAIPGVFRSMNKEQIIDTLEWFISSGRPAGNISYLPQLLQLFTVPIRVTAKMGGASGRLPHTIRSNQTIRYNRRLKAAGVNVPVNRNPRIDSVVVYKVEGENIMSFQSDEVSWKDKTVRLDNAKDPVILIEGGYTYFLGASTRGVIDYSRTMGGVWLAEEHYAYWQFQLDPQEAASVHFSKYMDIGGGMVRSLARLTPPSDRRITKFTMWVTVTDEVLNEMNRPEASALKEVSARFEYK